METRCTINYCKEFRSKTEQKNKQRERHEAKFLSVCLRLAELYASRAY